MNFNLPEEIQILRETVRRFGRQRADPTGARLPPRQPIIATGRADYAQLMALTDPEKKARGGIACFAVDLNFKPEQFVDLSFLPEPEKEGFFAEVAKRYPVK